MQHFIEYGLWGIFAFCFLGATLLPLPTELAIYQGLELGYSPFAIWLYASVGNGLGALSSYALGYWGEHRISEKQKNGKIWKKAEKWMLKYSKWALLWSWLPYIGDPMCILAGLFRIPLPIFVLFVWGTRTLRFALLIWFFQTVF